MPVVFASKESSLLKNHYKPSPCANDELRSVSNWYFDWNIEKCIQSHTLVCPGDEEKLLGSNLNSFPGLVDCLNGNILQQYLH